MTNFIDLLQISKVGSGCFNDTDIIMHMNIIDHNKQRNKVVILQYWFDGPPVEVQIKPHRNSKSSMPFFGKQGKSINKLQLLINQQKQFKLLLRKVAGSWNVWGCKNYHGTLIKLKITTVLGVPRIIMFYTVLRCNAN